MFKWRLYYDDGSTFSDADGAPHESPPWGVVVIGQPHAERHDRVLMNGDTSLYLYRSDLGRWCEIGQGGILDHLAHFGHLISCIRPGRHIPEREAFKALVARAQEDVADAR